MSRTPSAATEAAIAHTLPFCVVERRPRLAALAKIVMLSLAALTGAAPIIMVTALSAATPNAFQKVAENPLIGVQLVTGLLFWIVLLAVPFWRLVRTAGLERKVAVGADAVTIAERGFFGSREQSLPLTSYRGIAHRIRASLSGTRHELVLVGPTARANVVIASAARLSETDIERMCRMTGLPSIAAREASLRR